MNNTKQMKPISQVYKCILANSFVKHTFQKCMCCTVHIRMLANNVICNRYFHIFPLRE